MTSLASATATRWLRIVWRGGRTPSDWIIWRISSRRCRKDAGHAPPLDKLACRAAIQGPPLVHKLLTNTSREVARTSGDIRSIRRKSGDIPRRGPLAPISATCRRIWLSSIILAAKHLGSDSARPTRISATIAEEEKRLPTHLCSEAHPASTRDKRLQHTPQQSKRS